MEWTISLFRKLEEDIGPLCILADVTCVALFVDFPGIYALWTNVHFADYASLVAQRAESLRGGLNMLEGLKMFSSMHQSILSVLVGMKSRVDSRATSTTRSCAGECVCETCSLSSEIVEMGRSNILNTIAIQGESKIIGDNEEGISLLGRGSGIHLGLSGRHARE